MEPRRDPPPWPPVARSPRALPPGSLPRQWRRLTRSRRGAAGLAVVVAALLLWPFSDWSAIPWLVGLGVLVLLRLLRLDGFLRGWAPHLAGLAVVAGLMYSTTPWAWALAASIGVFAAGLVQLPWWRLAALGAVLCVISGVGFALASVQSAQQAAAQAVQSNHASQALQGTPRPQGVLPVLLNRIAENMPGPVCDNLLAEPARAAFVTSTGTADCPAAVAAVAARVTDGEHYASATARSTPTPTGLTVDACSLSWGDLPPAGPPLGRLTIGPKPGGSTYVVTGFAPC